MVSCAVCDCDVNYNNNPENRSFHRFPVDAVVRRKWLQLIGRPDWAPFKNSSICSKHFEEKYIKRRNTNIILLKGAIPTIAVPGFNVSENENMTSFECKFFSEPPSYNIEASNVEACRICLVTDVKMYSLQDTNLRRCMDTIAVIDKSCEGLPQYICYQCAPLLIKCNKLIEKSKTAQATLLGIFNKNRQITKSLIQEQNRSELNLQSPLDSHLYMDYSYIRYDDDISSDFVKPKLDPDEIIKIEIKEECTQEDTEQGNTPTKLTMKCEIDENEINEILSKIVDNADVDDDDDVEEIKMSIPVVEIPSDDEIGEGFISFDTHRMEVDKRTGGLISQRFQKPIYNVPKYRMPKTKGVSKKGKMKKKQRMKECDILPPVDPDMQKYFNIVEIPHRMQRRKFSCKSCPKSFNYLDEAKEHRYLGCVNTSDRRNTPNTGQSVSMWNDWSGNN